MLAHQPGNMTDLVKGLFNRLFAIRIDQTVGRRRQEAAGQQQIKINASLIGRCFSRHHPFSSFDYAVLHFVNGVKYIQGPVIMSDHDHGPFLFAGDLAK